MTPEDALEQARAQRWAGQSEEQAEYERRCSYWESLTEDQVRGREPVPPYVPAADLEPTRPSRPRRPA